MLDYHLLEALEAVVDTGSFHRGARKLHITQSAVSQRIALLEDQLGSPVVIRDTPPTPTRIGMQLIHHLREVRHKESTLDIENLSTQRSGWTEIILGANADSAATWFFEALQPELAKRRLLVKLLVETDELVHALIQRGEAQGCVVGKERLLPGCDTMYLGTMAYTCVCTPQFKDKWFKKGFVKEKITETPTILFDQHDTVQFQFLLRHFGIRKAEFPHHTVNSSSGYLALINSSCAYGMVPRMQIEVFLKNKSLVELAPQSIVELPLYWMYPRRGAATFKDLWSALQASASQLLKSKRR